LALPLATAAAASTAALVAAMVLLSSLGVIELRRAD
jgi:hypothetical protein